MSHYGGPTEVSDANADLSFYIDSGYYGNCNKSVRIEYDSAKRQRTLIERGPDFARATEIFAGSHFSAEGLREDYSEVRTITVGMLDDRMVEMVWTPRGEARRIISRRKANEREQTRYADVLG